MRIKNELKLCSTQTMCRAWPRPRAGCSGVFQVSFRPSNCSRRNGASGSELRGPERCPRREECHECRCETSQCSWRGLLGSLTCPTLLGSTTSLTRGLPAVLHQRPCMSVGPRLGTGAESGSVDSPFRCQLFPPGRKNYIRSCLIPAISC